MSNTKIILTADNMKVLKNMVKIYSKPKKGAIPILSFIKFEVTPHNKLKVLYCDTKLSIEREFTVHEIIPGKTKSFLVPISLIKDLTIGKLKLFSFQVTDNFTIVFNNGMVNNTVVVFDPEEFPRFPKLKDLHTTVALRYDTLKKLEAAFIATSNSETRPILTTINMKDDKIIATDSHRLYQSQHKGRVNEGDFVLNYELVKALLDNESEKDFFGVVKTNGNDLVIQTLDTTYHVSMQQGNYPETSRLMPSNFKTEIEVNNIPKLKQIITACRDLVKKDKKINPVVHLEYVDKNKIVLYAKSPAHGEVREELEVKSSKFEKDFKIAFSTIFMLDTLKQLNDSKLTFKFQTSMSPFIIHGKDEQTISLILPVRVY